MDFELTTNEDILSKELVSLAREDYNKLYQEEIELNDKFRQFVYNYKSVFEGRNTRRDQIIDSVLSSKVTHGNKRKYS